MVLKRVVCFLACSVLVFSEAAFVDTVRKCAIKDKDCFTASFNNIIKTISKTGVPELKMQPLDPLKIDNQKINVLNLFDLDIIKGTVTGIQDCVVDEFIIDTDKRIAKFKVECNKLLVDGDYKVLVSSPLIKDALGGDIYGDGHGKFVIEELSLKIKIPFYFEKRDGEIYLKLDIDHADVGYQELKNLELSADKLYIGDQESSQAVVAFVNSNWKSLSGTFGKAVIDNTLHIGFGILSKFFDFVPTKQYIPDDLSSYIN